MQVCPPDVIIWILSKTEELTRILYIFYNTSCMCTIMENKECTRELVTHLSLKSETQPGSTSLSCQWQPITNVQYPNLSIESLESRLEHKHAGKGLSRALAQSQIYPQGFIAFQYNHKSIQPSWVTKLRQVIHSQ